MNFLIDECLRPMVAEGLRDAGHDAIHVGDVRLLGATDEQVMSLAAEQSRVVVSADTDFGELLARNRLGFPSVILLRRNHDPDDQVRTILDALVDVADDLLRSHRRDRRRSSPNQATADPLTRSARGVLAT